jgi:integrase
LATLQDGITMSLYKQAGSEYWFVDLAVQGKRVRRSTSTTDKRQAQELHDRLKADLWRQDKLQETPDRDWDAAVKRFFVEKADKRTIEHDRKMLRWSAPYLRGKSLTSITTELIEELIQKRREGHTARTADGVSNATINRHMEAIQRILNCAVEWKWITKTPKIRHLTESEGRLRWLSKDEINRLLNALPDHLNAMARFTLAVGLRENNVLELEWSQVDTERRVCWIHADQSKNKKPFSVPLNSAALAVLEGQKGKHQNIVFPYNNKAMSKASTNAWYKAMISANIAGFTWHGLRHTWASWHVMNGTPLEVLQKLGGWSSLAIVMRYAHLAPSHIASWAENSGTTSVLRHSEKQEPHE